MRVFLYVFLSAASLVLCTAHLCLLNPEQRGSLTGINKSGATDCILLNAPCGDKKAETPVTVWRTGQNTTVVFQKNLDHWAKATPGYFVVNLIQGSKTLELTRVVDNGEPSLHIYSQNVAVPSTLSTGTYEVQVQYATNNPNAPPNFFQCSDVSIMS